MITAKLFIDKGGQAVQLPEEFNSPLGTSYVHIRRYGSKIILEPIRYSWANLKKGIDMLPDDFDLSRSPPDYSE